MISTNIFSRRPNTIISLSLVVATLLISNISLWGQCNRIINFDYDEVPSSCNEDWMVEDVTLRVIPSFQEDCVPYQCNFSTVNYNGSPSLHLQGASLSVDLSQFEGPATYIRIQLDYLSNNSSGADPCVIGYLLNDGQVVDSKSESFNYIQFYQTQDTPEFDQLVISAPDRKIISITFFNECNDGVLLGENVIDFEEFENQDSWSGNTGDFLFETKGIPVYAAPFYNQWPPFDTINNSNAGIYGQATWGFGSGNIFTAFGPAKFDFSVLDELPAAVSFDYMDWNLDAQVIINDIYPIIGFSSNSDFESLLPEGFSVEFLTPIGQTSGTRVTFYGPIESISIGGGEFFVDNVAWYPNNLNECVGFPGWPSPYEYFLPANLGDEVIQSGAGTNVLVTLQDYDAVVFPETGYYGTADLAEYPNVLFNASLLYDFAAIPGNVNEVRFDIGGPADQQTFDQNLKINYNGNALTTNIVNVGEYSVSLGGGYMLRIEEVVTQSGNDFELIFTGPNIESFQFGGTGLGFRALCYSSNVNNSCEITDIDASVQPCLPNGGFFVDLDIVFEGISDTFFVQFLDQIYGFSYEDTELPVLVGPIYSYFDPVVEITVFDGSGDCTLSTFVESPCPVICTMNNPVTELISCDENGDVYYSLDFDYENITGDSFVLYTNDLRFDFSLADLPVTVGPVPNNDFGIWGNPQADNSCELVFELIVECPPLDQCNFVEVSATAQPCTPNEVFFVDLNFENEFPGSMGFMVIGNGNTYGPFDYGNTPVTVGPFLEDGMDLEFAIIDLEDPFCIGWTEMDPVNCNQECQLSNLVITPLEQCMDNGANLYSLNFDYENVPSEEFRIYIDLPWVQWIEVQYANLPYIFQVDVPLQATDMDVLICDTELLDVCCVDATFVNTTCNDDCSIQDLEITAFDCGFAGGLAGFYLDFEHNNTGTFSAIINNNAYGSFNYNDLPVYIETPNIVNGFVVEVYVFDETNDECNQTQVFDSPCLPICYIDNQEMWVECDGDAYFVNIDFDLNTDLTDSVIITGLNQQFGPFSVNSLPIHLGPFFEFPDPFLTFTIEALNNQWCAGGIALQGPFCQEECSISNIIVEAFDCVDNQYHAFLDFDPNNFGAETFSVLINNNSFGPFNVSDLPLTSFGPITASPIGIEEFTIVHPTNDFCTETYVIQTPICEDDFCQASSLDVSVSDCENGAYFITVDFDLFNEGPYDYNIYFSDLVFGPHPVSAFPIVLGPFTNQNSEVIDIEIVAEQNSLCSNTFTVVTPDCQNCSITDIFIQPNSCNDGTFLVDLNFEYANFGSEGFSVIGNGQVYGEFTLNDLPISGLGPIEDVLNVYEFIIIDHANESCIAEAIIDTPGCNDQPCSIGPINYNWGECSSTGTSVNFDLDYQNTQGGGFEVYSQGDSIGYFPYSSLPITIFNLDIVFEDLVELTICDNGNPDCCETFYLQSPCADCDISNVTATPTECNAAGQYYVIVDLDYNNINSNGFQLWTTSGLNQIFSYSQLPVSFGPFDLISPDPFQINVNDLTYDQCGNEVIVTPPSCGNDCILEEISITTIDCNDAFYTLEVNFEYSNPLFEEFFLEVEGMDAQIFSFDQLPVQINVPYFSNVDISSLTICLNDIDVCCTTQDFEVPICIDPSCLIYDLHVETGVCSDDNQYYQISLNFEHQGTVSDSFLVMSNFNTFIGYYSYEDLPVLINSIPNSGNIVDVIQVFENDECSAALEYLSPNCSDCQFGSSSIMMGECENGFYPIILNITDIVNPGSDLFIIEINGNPIGEFSYTQLPLEFGSFNGNGLEEYQITIYDSEIETCASFFLVSGWECETEPCNLEDVETYTIDCNNDGTYSLLLNFDATGLENESFFVESQNVLYGNFNTTDLPIAIEEFQGTGNEVDQLTICLTDQNDCCTTIEFQALLCEGCEIGDLFTEIEPCEVDGQFYVELFFEHFNTGSIGFQVLGNGEEYGPFAYEDLPVTLGPFEGLIQQDFELHVFDIINFDCSSTTSFISPDCGPFAQTAVWPGDANFDNIAHNHDLLNIGVAYGFEGLPRPHSGIQWEAQAAADWTSSFGDPNINFKHADCNGDGIVNEEDLEALELNYGREHGAVSVIETVEGTPNDPSIFVDFDNATTLASGQAFVLPVQLGTEAIPVEEIYGLAFTITFDPNIINPSTIGVEVPNSFLGDVDSELISIDRTLEDEGRIEVAISKINQVNVGGHGTILYIIGVIDDLVGLHELELEFESLHAILSNEEDVPLFTPLNAAEITTSLSDNEFEGGLMLYPNPGVDYFNIRNMNSELMQNIRIYNALGQVMAEVKQPEQMQFISTSNWASGMYFVEIQIESSTITKKVKIARR